LKGLVRFGTLGLLFKVQRARNAPVHELAMGADACGACGAALKHVLSRGGALSPCVACGALNAIGALEDGPSTEEVDDTASDLGSPARVSLADEMAPFDDLSAGSTSTVGEDAAALDLPTFDGIEAKKALDLPTFDAIEVQKALDLPTFDAIEVKAEVAKLGAAAAPLFGALGLGAAPRRGADLPTFDAISVIREQGLSTQAAISVMKTEPSGEEPSKPLQLGPRVDSIAALGDAPVPGEELDALKTAPSIRPLAPRPAVLAPAGPAGTDLPDDPVEAIKREAGVSTDAAIELMRGGGSGIPPAQSRGKLFSGRQPAKEPDLFGEQFYEITEGRGPPKRAESAARGISLPNVDAVPLMAPDTSGKLMTGDGEDDFLMGRTDLDPSELVGSKRPGLVLYAIGFSAGLVGVVLILLRLLG
jgi:hypothetical protein